VKALINCNSPTYETESVIWQPKAGMALARRDDVAVQVFLFFSRITPVAFSLPGSGWDIERTADDSYQQNWPILGGADPMQPPPEEVDSI
jgi:hypothetical protein